MSFSVGRLLRFVISKGYKSEVGLLRLLGSGNSFCAVTLAWVGVTDWRMIQQKVPLGAEKTSPNDNCAFWAVARNNKARNTKPRNNNAQKQQSPAGMPARLCVWGCPGLFNAGGAGFAARYTQALAALPQAFAADAQFARQLCLAHGVLVFQDKALEVVFQG